MQFWSITVHLIKAPSLSSTYEPHLIKPTFQCTALIAPPCRQTTFFDHYALIKATQLNNAPEDLINLSIPLCHCTKKKGVAVPHFPQTFCSQWLYEHVTSSAWTGGIAKRDSLRAIREEGDFYL